MRADGIRNIIEKVQELPYQTILINGPWGVGKTYEIKKAMETTNSAYMISLFGVKSCEDIYKDIAWKVKVSNDSSEIKTSKPGDAAIKLLKGVKPLAEVAMEIYNINADLGGIAKELVRSYFKKNNHQIIVFDDIERINSEFPLDSFLGFVEELRISTKTKIILVANIDEIEGSNKNIFKRFTEKVIDKEYSIDNVSSEIDWNLLGIDTSFINEFINVHRLNNLRTIIKAQKFYEDVMKQITCDDNDRFMGFIKKICYSVVVEEIEGIYLKIVKHEMDKDDDKDGIKYLINKGYNDSFEQRVGRFYLDNSNDFETLIKSIADYYKYNAGIKDEVVLKGYNHFIQLGEKAAFYKSDDEILQVIENRSLELYSNENAAEAIKKLDGLVQWMELFEMDTREVIEKFNEYIYDFIATQFLLGEDVVIDPFGSRLGSDQVKELVAEINDRLPLIKLEKTVHRINTYVDKEDFISAYEIMYQLEQRLSKDGYSHMVLVELLNENILPIGSIEEKHWGFLHRLYKLCSREVKDELSAFTDNAIKGARSKMLVHRMNILKKQYLQ